MLTFAALLPEPQPTLSPQLQPRLRSSRSSALAFTVANHLEDARRRPGERGAGRVGRVGVHAVPVVDVLARTKAQPLGRRARADLLGALARGVDS